MPKNKRDEWVGNIRKMKCGTEAKIIEYKNANDITIQFLDKYGFIKKSAIKEFKNGIIKNPYNPSVCNIGYIGVGKYNTVGQDSKHNQAYETWVHMLQRCYNNKIQEKYPYYKNCTVCEEWLNFQNFAKWFYDNLWDENFIYLDKDILFKGNKIYSPKTCILIDNNINCIFTKTDKLRGKYPIGVYYKKANKKFVAQCNYRKGKQKYLGLYNTPEEAFEVYKNFKESYIKSIANDYKNKYEKFPTILYNALINYVVEITD